MQRRLHIGCDVDGVLADFLTPTLKLINHRLRRQVANHYKPEHVTGWNICESLGHPKLHSHLFKHWTSPGFCAKLKPYPDAQDTVKTLQTLGELYAITAPMTSVHWAGERLLWLNKHLGLSKSHVIQCEAKHLVAVDVFIDDKWENVKAWAEWNPRGKAILWHPLREVVISVDEPRNIHLARDWKTVFQIIKDLINLREQNEKRLEYGVFS